MNYINIKINNIGKVNEKIIITILSMAWDFSDIFKKILFLLFLRLISERVFR